MQARKKTLAALRRHVRNSERRKLEAQMEGAGLTGEVRVAAEIQLPPKPDQIDNEVSDHVRRAIPSGYTGYDPKSLKPLAEVLWAMSVALGHAMTAHRKFTKLKSSTISPDGLLGGRGYVMSVKDIRNALHDACEAISAVSDTIHDEINAPHWKPKLSEMEMSDKDNVERLVGDAEKNLDNPESDIEDDMYHAEMAGEPADLETDQGLSPEEFGQEVEDGVEGPDGESAGPGLTDPNADAEQTEDSFEEEDPDATDEWDDSNPFGVTEESDEDNPFAGDEVTDPAAESESDEDNPFAEEGDAESDEGNPFAAEEESEDNPFAGDEESTETDETTPEEDTDNPFAEDSEGAEETPEPTEEDPFADTDEADGDEESTDPNVDVEPNPDDELVGDEVEDTEPDPFADDDEESAEDDESIEPTEEPTDEVDADPDAEEDPFADPFADTEESDESATTQEETPEGSPAEETDESVPESDDDGEELFQDMETEDALSETTDEGDPEVEEDPTVEDESLDEESEDDDPFSKALDAYYAAEAQENSPEAERFDSAPVPGEEDEENPEEDEEEDEEFRSALPDGEDAADSFVTKKQAARRSANSSIPVQTLSGPRVQHLDRGDSDQTGPFGSYNSDEPHSDYDQWSADDGVSNDPSYTPDPVRTGGRPWNASSTMPVDSTPTEGYDFGIGYGEGNDAHGQGAGGYSNPTPDGKGVYGPSSQMPHDPGGKLHDDDSDTTPMVELSVGRRTAKDWKADSRLPNDVQPRSVARSDYYRGVKDTNMFDTVRGQSELPDFARNDYESDTDSHPGLGYRFEQGTEPYVKWDSETKNMRTDDINQRDDQGPYVREG